MDQKSSRVQGYALRMANHGLDFSTNFVLPDLRHNLDHSNMVYLDKGTFTDTGLENYQVAQAGMDRDEFKLYFKGLGVGDKDKEKVLGDN